MKKINLIQNEATPHNNLLIKALADEVGIDNISLYYAMAVSNQYQWEEDLTNKIKNANAIPGIRK